MKTRQKKVSLKDASHLYEVERRAYHLERPLDSGAKCNRAKQTGFARLCQAL